jgi:hypothetical protein
MYGNIRDNFNVCVQYIMPALKTNKLLQKYENSIAYLNSLVNLHFSISRFMYILKNIISISDIHRINSSMRIHKMSLLLTIIIYCPLLFSKIEINGSYCNCHYEILGGQGGIFKKFSYGFRNTAYVSIRVWAAATEGE